jgi:hypothetical protein
MGHGAQKFVAKLIAASFANLKGTSHAYSAVAGRNSDSSYHPDPAVTLSTGRTRSLVHGGDVLPEAWRIILAPEERIARSMLGIGSS